MDGSPPLKSGRNLLSRRAILTLVLATWVGTTLACMWYLNPIGPTGYSLCLSPRVPGK